ncbi:hypothetical protein DLJ46_23240 [Micromonospora globispora]|uniref:Uncharacterized protein n=2 Tax=Micromonospora globispora TaxID=1450148 RepID=A0A317JY64_9ACTN|nr:hypothetical protein DLJ46_23240 [Micromonospora globispora]
MGRTGMPSWYVGVGIAIALIGLAVVVLFTGGAERWPAALLLLFGVPLMLAIGGALEQAWRVTPHPSVACTAASSTGVQRRATRVSWVLTAAVGVIHLVVAVLLAWFAIKRVGDGDVVLLLVALPFAAVAVWRSVSLLRRVIAAGPHPDCGRDRE